MREEALFEWSGSAEGASHSRERRGARGLPSVSSFQEEKEGDVAATIDRRRGYCEAVEKCRGRGGGGSDAQRVKSSEAVEKDVEGEVTRGGNMVNSSEAEKEDVEELCVLRSGFISAW